MVLMGAPMGSKPPKLIEGVDYYLEGGRCVLTEVFHLKRGYCCNSGCRHCPYREDDGGEAATDVVRVTLPKLPQLR